MKWTIFFRNANRAPECEDEVVKEDGVYYEVNSQGVRLNLNSLVSDQELTQQVREYKETTSVAD